MGQRGSKKERRIVGAAFVVGFVGSVTLGGAEPAGACHHFQVWRYRFPQRCPIGVEDRHRHRHDQPRMARVALVRRPVVERHVVAKAVDADRMPGDRAQPQALLAAKDEAHILLSVPILTLADMIGGDPDEETRARLMLHAAFSSASPPAPQQPLRPAE